MTKGFVHDQNIQRFLEMLQAETDPRKRAVIERLLLEERATKRGGDARPSTGVHKA